VIGLLKTELVEPTGQRHTAEQLEIATWRDVGGSAAAASTKPAATFRRHSWRRVSPPPSTPHRGRVLDNPGLRAYRGDSFRRFGFLVGVRM